MGSMKRKHWLNGGFSTAFLSKKKPGCFEATGRGNEFLSVVILRAADCECSEEIGDIEEVVLPIVVEIGNRLHRGKGA